MYSGKRLVGKVQIWHQIYLVTEVNKLSYELLGKAVIIGCECRRHHNTCSSAHGILYQGPNTDQCKALLNLLHTPKLTKLGSYVTSSENFDTSTSLGVGVAKGLYSAP